MFTNRSHSRTAVPASPRRASQVARPLARTLLGLAAAGLALASVAQEYTNIDALKRLAQLQTRINANAQTAAYKWADRLGLPKRIDRPNGQIIELVALKNGRPIYRTTHNLEAAISVGVNHLWPGGSSALNLTGGGVTMGIWEAGGVPDVAHREFGGRVTIRDGSQSASGHATHVAGIMIAAGLDPQAKGMSFAGRLDAYDAGNDTGEMAASASSHPLSNHSYGFIAGWVYGGLGDDLWVWLGDSAISTTYDYKFGWYPTESAVWDNVCYNAPFYLPVISAGNSRNGGPPAQPVEHWEWDPSANDWAKTSEVRDGQNTYYTIPFGGQTAKNTLTIGAVEAIPGGYQDPSDVEMADFSSWGPTHDGRVKPDLVAPGVNIYSTYPGNDYGWASGTSMSGPVVAGSLGLIAQLYREMFGGNMRASTLKALAIHTANPASFDPGPSYSAGWGILNAEGAAKTLQESVLGGSVVAEYTLNQRGTINVPFYVNEEGAIRATICWTDPPGSPITASFGRTRNLVNDLDLRIIHVETGTVYEPFVLNLDAPGDPATTGDNVVDPVEQVLIEDPVPGNYIIRINHKGGMLRPSGAQLVSLVMTAPMPNGFSDLAVRPDPVIGGIDHPTATLTLAAPATEDLEVKLWTSRPNVASVPSSVTVQKGRDSVDFKVTTYPVRPVEGDRVTVSVHASSSLGFKTASFDVLPVTVQSVTLSTYNVVGGGIVNGTVWLNSPAPSSGAAVSLSSSIPTVARPIRNWVLVPRGATSATFSIRTYPVTELKPVMIRATRLGSTVEPVDEFGDPRPLEVARASLSSLEATPNLLSPGESTIVTVGMDGPAPAKGAVIQISSTSPSVLPVPASVTIPAGRRSVSFTAKAGLVTELTSVTIKATRGSSTKDVLVRIRP